MKTLPLVLTVVGLLGAAACTSPTQSPVATSLPAATPLAPPATVGPVSASALAPTVVAATATADPAATATPFAVTSTANPAVAGGLVGMWQGNNNSFYLLNKDGTWSWDQKLQQLLTAPENTGRWWVEGDIVRIQDLAGKAPCPLEQIGSYQAQVSSDTLVLTAVADLCAPRIDQTQGQYSRQPAGP